MKASITQEDGNGCGAACTAFVANRSYGEVVSLLGKTSAQTRGFYCRDLVEALQLFNLSCTFIHLSPKRWYEYPEGSIVFIKRSKHYPAGHWLARHNGQWMDPWINVVQNNDLRFARSGYRKRLPGVAQWMCYPLLDSPVQWGGRGRKNSYLI